jgi:hypothetical protein
MLKSYLLAVVAISSLMVAWAIVQRAWARMFTPSTPGIDVLEQRRSCGSCGCASPCSTRSTDEAGRISLEEGSTD